MITVCKQTLGYLASINKNKNRQRKIHKSFAKIAGDKRNIHTRIFASGGSKLERIVIRKHIIIVISFHPLRPLWDFFNDNPENVEPATLLLCGIAEIVNHFSRVEYNTKAILDRRGRKAFFQRQAQIVVLLQNDLVVRGQHDCK